MKFSDFMFVSAGLLCINMHGTVSSIVLIIAFNEIKGCCNGLVRLFTLVDDASNSFL
jgi:hypothetical protein